MLNTKNAQINLYKTKLYNQRSLFKGGNILILDGLEKLKILIRKAANDAITKQKTKIREYKNKAKRLRYKVGVKA